MSVQFLAVFTHCAVTILWFMFAHNEPFCGSNIGHIQYLNPRGHPLESSGQAGSCVFLVFHLKNQVFLLLNSILLSA
ncbi:MAG: hypothetical protein COB48_04520 [Pseudoalteromonas sp.]|nr:MAG: hypothetical protein COB48_04520 [Pseudoalteromonas sp.]